MNFQNLIGIIVALWLCSILVCGVALWLGLLATPRRFVAAELLSVATLGIGSYGLTYFHVVASKTVNGHTRWSFNSKWFFLATLILGAATLSYTIWKHKTAKRPELAAAH